jgi:hypothetical protein
VENGRIYCHFGNHGVVAFDMDAKQFWEDGPYSIVESKYGAGASPALYKSSGLMTWAMAKNEQCYTTPPLIQAPTRSVRVQARAWRLGRPDSRL